MDNSHGGIEQSKLCLTERCLRYDGPLQMQDLTFDQSHFGPIKRYTWWVVAAIIREKEYQRYWNKLRNHFWGRMGWTFINFTENKDIDRGKRIATF